MMAPYKGLRPRRGVTEIEGGWRLSIPAGGAGGPRDLAAAYRLAELEDYLHLPRRRFPHRPPLRLSLRARASAADLPGTWGFGWWNDPFSLSLGLGGGVRRIPALPNAAWFFFASRHNYLSFRQPYYPHGVWQSQTPELAAGQRHLPASGALAAAFRAAPLPGWALAPAALGLPLLGYRPLARFARRLAARLIREDAAALAHDPTGWHAYEIEWRENAVSFRLDGRSVLESAVSPRPPLGLVLWLDNQYAAWRPDGSLGYGFLANQPAWIEIRDLALEALPA